MLAYVDRNLILTGYTGPNAPIISQQIAERLKMRYVDVDAQIEARAGVPLENMRSRYGEARLKMLEAEVMQDVLLHRSSVIHISGQTILRGEYGKRLQETGPVVCLVVTLDSVLRRLHMALGGLYHNPHERAVAIDYLKREWEVRKLEGIYEIDVTYLNEAESVNAVCALWQTMALSGVYTPVP